MSDERLPIDDLLEQCKPLEREPDWLREDLEPRWHQRQPGQPVPVKITRGSDSDHQLDP